MVAVIVTLAGCGSTPRAPGPRCPELDFAVVLDSSLPDRFSHVIPLPDGDVVLAGYYGGDPAVAPGGPPLPFGYGARDSFVARVSPDGDVRWQHGFGGREVDTLEAVSVVHGTVWVAATVDGVELQLDREPIPGTSEGEVDWVDLADVGVFGFSLDTGSLHTAYRVSHDESQSPTGITADPSGNLYVVGDFHSSTMAIGPWIHENSTVDQGIRDEQAFLTSFTADGVPRWLTTWGNDSFARPAGVGWLGDHLVVGGTWAYDPVEALSSDGTAHPLTPGVLDLLSFDPETGRPTNGSFAASGFGLGTIDELEQAADGTIVITGDSKVGDTWTSRDGTSHQVPPSATALVNRSFRVRLGLDGDLHEPWFVDPLLWGSSATSDPVAIAGWANELYDPDGSVAFDPPEHLRGHDGMAATFDADDHLTCAWLFAGDDDESALDAAFDARGGLWIVGEFTQDVVVTNSDGATVAEWTAARDSIDGFVMRFRGVADP